MAGMAKHRKKIRKAQTMVTMTLMLENLPIRLPRCSFKCLTRRGRSGELRTRLQSSENNEVGNKVLKHQGIRRKGCNCRDNSRHHQVQNHKNEQMMLPAPIRRRTSGEEIQNLHHRDQQRRRRSKTKGRIRLKVHILFHVKKRMRMHCIRQRCRVVTAQQKAPC